MKKRHRFKRKMNDAKRFLDQGKTTLQREMDEFREWFNAKRGR